MIGRTHVQALSFAFEKFNFWVVMASGIVGTTAPDFEITFIGGETKKLSAFIEEGKPIIIDFYANF